MYVKLMHGLLSSVKTGFRSHFLMFQGCISVGKALHLPTASILSGYCLLGSYLLSPETVCFPGTEWSEPVLLWLTVCMPTGSGKSTLFRHLYGLLQRVRDLCHVHDDDPVWGCWRCNI